MLENVRGFWVPRSDAARFRAFPEYAGLPNADVHKVKESISHCAQRRTALDIGAHVGITATFLSRSFADVYAFEPVPDHFRCLERNAALIGNLHPIQTGIGRGAGTLRFEYVPHHGQLSHALLDGESAHFEKSDIIGPIPIRTIDAFNLDDVDFIKIDVEGFEGPVVEGARDTILRCRPIILMEQRGNEKVMHGDRVDRDEAAKFVEALGMVRLPTKSFRRDFLYRFPRMRGG